MDAPCTTRTFKRHLNKEKIKHKKRIHRPKLIMKYKLKQLEYACRYQMNTKEWQKVVFSDKKRCNLRGSDGFQKYWHAKNFQKRITQQGKVEKYLLWSKGGFLIFRIA